MLVGICPSRKLFPCELRWPMIEKQVYHTSFLTMFPSTLWLSLSISSPSLSLSSSSSDEPSSSTVAHYISQSLWANKRSQNIPFDGTSVSSLSDPKCVPLGLTTGGVPEWWGEYLASGKQAESLTFSHSLSHHFCIGYFGRHSLHAMCLRIHMPFWCCRSGHFRWFDGHCIMLGRFEYINKFIMSLTFSGYLRYFVLCFHQLRVRPAALWGWWLSPWCVCNNMIWWALWSVAILWVSLLELDNSVLFSEDWLGRWWSAFCCVLSMGCMHAF